MLLEKGFYECVCVVKEVKSVIDVKKNFRKYGKVYEYMYNSFYLCLKI